jgi:hypothetical protein
MEVNNFTVHNDCFPPEVLIEDAPTDMLTRAVRLKAVTTDTVQQEPKCIPLTTPTGFLRYFTMLY